VVLRSAFEHSEPIKVIEAAETMSATV